jgi:hypothetical protein
MDLSARGTQKATVACTTSSSSTSSSSSNTSLDAMHNDAGHSTVA